MGVSEQSSPNWLNCSWVLLSCHGL